MYTYRVRSCWVLELVHAWPPVMQGCMLGSFYRVHASKGRTVLKQLKRYHTKRVDVYFEVVGLMSEHLWSHVAV